MAPGVEGLPRLAPQPGHHRRPPRLAIAVVAGALERLVRLVRLLQGTAGGRRGAAQRRLAAVAQHVEVVVLLGGGRKALPPPRRADLLQSLGQAGAAILGDLLQGGQLGELLGPGHAVAVRDQPAADPAQALRLGHHEDGLAAHEDLVGHGLAHARPGKLVEGRQQGPGALSSGLAPAAALGHAGRVLAEADDQEAAGEGEADALGLGRGGELGLLVLIDNDGLLQAALQVVTAGLELVELLSEVTDVRAVAVAVEVAQDGAGLAVDGLSAQAVALGESCDVAVASEEDGGGAGEAVEQG